MRYAIEMSKRKEKRGRYMDEWPEEQKSAIMSMTAKARWIDKTPEEKRELAMRMVEARRNRKMMREDDGLSVA